MHQDATGTATATTTRLAQGRPATTTVRDSGSGGATQDGREGSASGRQTAAPARSVGQGATTAAGTPAAASAQSSVSSTSTDGAGAPAPTTASTAASYASSAATAARAPVDLQHAIDAVRASFTMAVRQGQTQALITLSPRSLGAIRISLSQTSDGLVARVSADHPEALQLLAQNSSGLRNSLQASGLQLLRLDISAGAQSGEQSDASDSTSPHRGSAGGQSDDRGGEESAPNAGLSTSTSLSASAGSLVDVLA